METPSSMRRLTRSLASAPSQKSKQDDALSRSRNSGNPDRSALLDITNDSPIVGLAAGGLVEKTPSSSVAKNRVNVKRTPGSGEALLRGQVKTLLQKVEEEGELVSKLSFGEERPPLRVLMGLPVSPALLLAPTPANTPQIPSLCGSKDDVVMSDLIVPSPEEEDPKIPSEVAEDLKQGELLGANECLINRALLFDSPGKSEMSDSSTISYQGSGRSYREKSSEDDNSSSWSLQVNPSIQEEDEEGVDDFEEETDVYHEGDEEDEQDGEEEDEHCYDDLCEGLMKMSVREDKVGLPEFAGKHTRFVYNSDDDIEGEEEVKKKIVSPGVLLLKGLPAPEGKHLRFQEEQEEE